MFRNDNTREGADLRRLLLAVTAVAVMVLAAFAMVSSDSSDADPAVDGKTFYYDQLTESQKEIYDKLCTMTLENPGISTVLEGITSGQIESIWNQYCEDENAAFTAFKNEHLEMFWITNEHANGYHAEGGTMTLTTTVSVSTQWGSTNAEIASSMAAVDTFVDSIPVNTTTRYSKVVSIHSAVCDLLAYTPVTPVPGGNELRNIATAFLDEPNHYVVCEGFAKAFKYLCDKYDVPCILMSGWGYQDAADKTANLHADANRHMWNLVQMENGKWYLVDATWDDNGGSMTTTYLLAGSNADGYRDLKVGQDHEADGDGLAIPLITTTSYSDVEYDIIFYDEDGSTVISALKYPLNDTITVPANPTKDPTNTQVFTFKCWVDMYDDSEVSSFDPVTEDKFFKAKYHSEPRKYTVVFKDSVDRGSTVLQSLEYLYDAPLTAPVNPADSKDDYFCYTFLQWSPAVPATVTTEMEIVAQYQKIKNFTEDAGNLLVKSRGDNISFNAADITIIQGSTGTLTVVMPDATIVFDNTAAKALSAEETLSVDIRDFKTLSKEARDLIGNAVVYEIDFGTNSNAFSAGKATVNLKFTPSAEQDKDNLKLFHVAGTTSTEVPCTYADGMLTFETTHFSTYAIQIPEEKNLDIIGMLMENYVLIAILLFAFLGMAISYKMS